MGKAERKLSILEVLPDVTEAMRPSGVGEIVGLSPLNAGRFLSDMGKSGLARKPDKKKSFYEITEKGQGYLGNPPNEVEGEELEVTTEGNNISKSQKVTAEDVTKDITEDITEEVAVPSQADLFRGIGEKLGIGRKKGEVNLNTIIYFVQETADLDNLLSVWNALWLITAISL